MSSSHRPVVGGVYRRELLHSQATYRVVAIDDDHVDVEALEVPGLPEGHRMRLTRDSVAAMEPLVTPVAAPAEAAEPADLAAGAEPRLGLA
jgi:hypothetical protein